LAGDLIPRFTPTGSRIGAGGEGHSDPAITLRRYAHVLEDMEDEGGRAMDELF
jgi:hypothetical protein